MNGAHPRNTLKVQLWLSMQKPGRLFTSQDVSHHLNLTSSDVGHILKWQECVKKAEIKMSDNSRAIWEIIYTPEKPICPKNMKIIPNKEICL